MNEGRRKRISTGEGLVKGSITGAGALTNNSGSEPFISTFFDSAREIRACTSLSTDNNQTPGHPNHLHASGIDNKVVFDRYGRLAWRSTGYNKPWDGTANGKPLTAGVYYYVIDPKSGFEKITGSITIIR